MKKSTIMMTSFMFLLCCSALHAMERRSQDDQMPVRRSGPVLRRQNAFRVCGVDENGKLLVVGDLPDYMRRVIEERNERYRREAAHGESHE